MRRHAIGMLAAAAISAVLAAPASAGITEFALQSPFSLPTGLTAGPDGNVWVALPGSSRIARVTPGGEVVEFTLPAGREPLDLTSSGGVIWFTERAGDRIGRIDPSAGTPASIQASIAEFVVPGAGSQPTEIAAGPDGNLWFTEPPTDQIGRITPAGTISEFLLFTGGSRPVGITAGPDGAIWFTMTGTNRVGRMTTAGAITNEFGIPGLSTSSLGSITAGPDGALWFVDGGLDQVRRITTSGEISGFAAPAGSTLGEITTGPDGALWLTEQRNGRIARMTTAGIFSEFTLPSTTAGPIGIAPGPDGALWFSERFDNKVGRITTDTVPDKLPTGPVGPTGPSGPAGPSGPSGPAGESKLVLVAFQVSPARPRTGRKITVKFAITGAADVVLQAKRGRAAARTVARKSVKKAGTTSIAWNGKIGRKRAPRGTYVLTVRATKDGRSVSSNLRVKLR